MDKENYIDLVNEHIELDKLLSVTNPKFHEEIKKLLNEKKEIIKNNGFFAGIKLNKIDKRLEKIKELSKQNN